MSSKCPFVFRDESDCQVKDYSNISEDEILIEANSILNSLDKMEQKLYDNSIKDNVILEMLVNVRSIMEELKIEIINCTNTVNN